MKLFCIRIKVIKKIKKLPVKLVVDESIDFHQVKEIYKVFIECSEQEEKLLDLGTLEYMRYFKGQIIIEPADKYKGILENGSFIKGKRKGYCGLWGWLK